MNRTLYYLLLALIIPYSMDAKFKEAKVKKQLVTDADKSNTKSVKTAPVANLEGEETFSLKTSATGLQMKEFTVEEMDALTVQENKEALAADYNVSIDGLPKSKELEDMLKKRRMIIDLVKEGKNFFIKESLHDSCNAFIKTKQFIRGEVYIFVFDADGFCLAQGQNTEGLWQDFNTVKDEYGSVFINDFIEKARAGGGWVSYRYNNASKVAYVELVEKYGRQYVIGAGYYPHSKVYACMNLVKGATRFFKDSIKNNLLNDSIFSTLSYPLGRFVSGDLYLFVLDESGVLMVQGDRPTLVGSNAYLYKDAKGVYVNQEIINRLNKTSDGIWLDYISKGAPKRVYAEKVTDKQGKNYYIVCGYYVDSTREKLVEIVQEGYRHMKKGVEQAFKDFNDRNDHLFHYGDLDLEVYDMKGKCVANGANPESVGRLFFDEKDENGNFYVQKILEVARKNDRGWVNFKIKNAYQWIYLEKVDVGLEEYVITGGLYPISKREAMELLAKDAVEQMKSAREVKYALNQFVKKQGKFVLGDLEVFVFEHDGTCAVYGDRTDYIWRDMINEKDEAGRPYVKLFINAARRTPARVVYKMNGANALAYVEKVEKDGLTLYIGSSYYTYDNLSMKGLGTPPQ